MSDFNINGIDELYLIDKERLALAKKRQAAVFAGRKPDKWPGLIFAPLTASQEKVPSANFKEAFESPEMMTCSQMRVAMQGANSGSDVVPSIRVNFGTGIMLSCLGLEQQVFPDKMPWLKEHMTPEQVAKLTVDDIKIQGSFAKGLEYIEFFKKYIGDSPAIFCMDTQGPFDLAHLLVGDEIFYLLYDDPELVHHIMEICLELGIRTHSWMKEITGEPLDQIHHSSSMYAENMGIRICEDTTVLISEDAMDEFAMPYTRRLADHFGGAWIHYCGRNDNLTKRICDMDNIRAINFGHIPGHELDHNFEADMQLCAGKNKVYFGEWPRWQEETGKEYLERLFKWAAQGCLVPFLNSAIDGVSLRNHNEVLEYWYNL